MIPFQPADPFPLLGAASYTEGEAQDHAALVDHWFGLQTSQVEAQLIAHGCRQRASRSSGELQQLWIGLAPARLQTPYVDFRRWLAWLKPKPGQKIIDLGAAYGRLGFVVGWHYPGVAFVGYEYVGERVLQFRKCITRFASRDLRMEHADLSLKTFYPEAGDIYFIYDFGSPKAIEKVLHDVRRVADERPVCVVVRGRTVRASIDLRHDWLRVDSALERCDRFAVYRSHSHPLHYAMNP